MTEWTILLYDGEGATDDVKCDCMLGYFCAVENCCIQVDITGMQVQVQFVMAVMLYCKII